MKFKIRLAVLSKYWASLKPKKEEEGNEAHFNQNTPELKSAFFLLFTRPPWFHLSLSTLHLLQLLVSTHTASSTKIPPSFHLTWHQSPLISPP